MEAEEQYNLTTDEIVERPFLKLINKDNSMRSEKKILLIEDSEPQRIFYQKLFESLNYMVDACESTELAIQKVEQENNIFLIVADINMVGGGISGLSFARRYQDVYPILLMSDETSVTQAKEEGFVTLVKSVEDSLLTNKVNKCLKDFSKTKTIYETRDGLHQMKQEVKGLKSKIEDHSEETRKSFDDIKTLICELKPSKNLQHAENLDCAPVQLPPSPVAPPSSHRHGTEIGEIFDLVEKLLGYSVVKTGLSKTWALIKFTFSAWKKILLFLFGMLLWMFQDHPAIKFVMQQESKPKPTVSQTKKTIPVLQKAK